MVLITLDVPKIRRRSCRYSSLGAGLGDEFSRNKAHSALFRLMGFSELPNLPSKLPPKMASRELFWSLWGHPREAQNGPKRGQ